MNVETKLLKNLLDAPTKLKLDELEQMYKDSYQIWWDATLEKKRAIKDFISEGDEITYLLEGWNEDGKQTAKTCSGTVRTIYGGLSGVLLEKVRRVKYLDIQTINGLEIE